MLKALAQIEVKLPKFLVAQGAGAHRWRWREDE
jgi:hypothetical protein